MSHVDARQLGSQQRAARIGRLELQLEDIGMMQRLHDLQIICGPEAPSSTHFGVCLTMRIHVHCSTEVFDGDQIYSFYRKKMFMYDDCRICAALTNI